MIELTTNYIRLGASANSKAEAITLVADLLIQNGNMLDGYALSMLGREKISNTYLGNGIAIPHGLQQDRNLIVKTGVAVAQFPQGVEWGNGELAYLVVGIAAKSDEHIEVLANLTHVLDDADIIRELRTTKDAADILNALSKPQAALSAHAISKNSESEEHAFLKSIDVELAGESGLHARPAGLFVELAKQFESDIRVQHGDKVANGKSLVSLLKLGANKRVTLRIMVRGSDEDSALQALAQAVKLGLEDDADSGHALALPSQTPALTLATPPMRGIASSVGIAIGPIYHFNRDTMVISKIGQSSLLEEVRLREAIVTAKNQLQELHDDVMQRSGAAHAAIFKAHQEFLDDPDLVEGAYAQITVGHSAGWAWRNSYEMRAEEVAALESTLLKERANDILDVGRRVLRLLADKVETQTSGNTDPMILIADDLSPSDTARLDPKQVLAICTAHGGSTSHTAIIARSLGIPAVVGLGADILALKNGDTAIVDGNAGCLYINPSQEDLARAKQAQREEQAISITETLACYEPAITRDGRRMHVVANIGSAVEAEQAVNAGAEGVGLLRTEFLFLQRDQAPSEEEQYQALLAMTSALNGLPLIVRTLDIGGDKEVPYLSLPHEQNPFLGVRGIRLCLARQDLFRPQLRAIYRAAALAPIKIMFPMIATLDELVQAKAIAEEVRAELNADPVEIGMMIEVPSAVLMAPELAPHVDFFSIGTNDLTQYVLAMDRMHPSLSQQADALHPAVLRMIDMTVKAANAGGIWVGVCGGIAGDVNGAAILTGLGVSELSISIPSVAAIKAKLRNVAYADCVALAQRALACSTAAQVRAI